jgi:hypothetical protein
MSHEEEDTCVNECVNECPTEQEGIIPSTRLIRVYTRTTRVYTRIYCIC